MVNPGAFLGSRKDFLNSQIDLYAAAVTGNHVADTVADIQRRYFKRYPISLAHNVEPSLEWLSNVDDNAADEDLLPPDESKLDGDAFKVAKEKYDELVKELKFRKDQISRRLAYQHSKSHNPPKRIEAGSEDPMTVLMAKLVKIPLKKPRVRPAHTVWAQHHRQFVDTIFEERVRDGKVSVDKHAALRMKIYKECFNELEADEKKEYQNRAVEENRAAIEKIELALNSPASKDPADRQQILQGFPSFIQPILDLVTEYTGWKATLMVGGPEPADNGRLNVMSFHSGETSGDVKMNFGRSERRAYKDIVTPIFGHFLKKCYTVEECRAAALPDPTAVSLADLLRMEGGEFSVDAAEDTKGYVRIARTPSGGTDVSVIPKTPKDAPSTYEIPTKLGPPIHAKKPQERLLSDPERTASTTTSPHVSNAIPSLPLSSENAALGSGSVQHASAPPSPCPSPAATPVGSPTLTPQALPDVTPMPPLTPATPTQLPRAQSPARTTSTAREDPATQTAGESSRLASKRKRCHVTQDGPVHTKASKVNDAPPRRLLRSNVDAGTRKNPAKDVILPSLERATAPLSREELSDAPDWFLEAYQMLLSKDFGTAWTQLIRVWAQFEKAESFAENEKLGSKGRPVCIRDWIARARSTTYRPDVGPLGPYSKSFNAWWRGIQPDWRLEGGVKLLQKPSGDLESLRRPGKNGLLSVLAALFFWAINASKGSEGGAVQSPSWKAAVGDVYWVLKNLVPN